METTVLRNYAEALYDEAAERNEVQPTLAGMEALAEVLNAEPELRRVAAHPGIPDARKLALLSAALGGKGTPLLEDALRLLLRRGRVGDLPELAAALGRVVEERAGRQPVLVESSATLTEEQVRRLEVALTRLAGGPVAVSWRVEPEVLGGLRIHINSEVLDESLAGRLERLEEHLTGSL